MVDIHSRVLPSFDNNFLFDENIRYAEDYEAALRVYKLANSLGYLVEPLYFYHQNDESIMHVVNYCC